MATIQLKDVTPTQVCTNRYGAIFINAGSRLYRTEWIRCTGVDGKRLKIKHMLRQDLGVVHGEPRIGRTIQLNLPPDPRVTAWQAAVLDALKGDGLTTLECTI